MTLRELITLLQTKEPRLDEEVEYIVLTTAGQVVSMDISTQAKPIEKLMKRF